MVLTPASHSLLSTQCKVLFFGKSGDQPILENIALQCGCTRTAAICPTHGGETVILRLPTTPPPKADAIATDVPRLLVSIKVADCQNFVVCAPAPRILGLIHAGWRGMNVHIISSFFHTIHREWGILPQETFIWAGPSLCHSCAEFTNPLVELPNIDSQFFHDRHVDLQGAALQEFISIGVPEKHIERHPDCTCCHPKKYWTYRGGDREAVLQGKENILACTLL